MLRLWVPISPGFTLFNNFIKFMIKHNFSKTQKDERICTAIQATGV